MEKKTKIKNWKHVKKFPKEEGMFRNQKKKKKNLYQKKIQNVCAIYHLDYIR